MKVHVMMAVTLSAALPVLAQTGPTMTLYGIVDVAARKQSGLAANYVRASGESTTVASGVGPTSRWGIRGSEDLGGGLRATFNLESGINVDSGVAANSVTYFDRASVVGLAGGFGTITLGRQNTLVADSVGLVDPIGLRFAGLNPNIQNVSLTGHQLAVEYGATGSTGASNRVNNSIKYVKAFGPVVARAMVSLGENAGSISKQNSAGVGLDYVTRGLNVTAAYTEFRDANDRKLRAAQAGLSWLVTPTLRVMANIGHNTGATSATAEASNRILVGGVNWAVTQQVDVLAGYYKVDRERTGQADDGFARLLTFVEYKFSRRSKVYVEFDHTRWKGNYIAATNKSRSNGVSLGVTHAF